MLQVTLLMPYGLRKQDHLQVPAPNRFQSTAKENPLSGRWPGVFYGVKGSGQKHQFGHQQLNLTLC